MKCLVISDRWSGCHFRVFSGYQPPTPAICNTSAGTGIGVALDVYEEEEGIFFEDHSEHLLQDDILSRLLTFPNVLITSHQAFLTREALLEIGRVTAENLMRFARGGAFLDGTAL